MTTKITDASNFLDVNGLNDIRLQSKQGDQASKKEALQQAAKQFEAIFMQMLMKSMRSAQDVLESDSPFNSESTKFYRDMHDQQLAVELSDNGSLGLSDLIVRQLGGDSDNFTPRTILRSDGKLSTENATLNVPSLASGDGSLNNSSKQNTDTQVSNNRQVDIPYSLNQSQLPIKAKVEPIFAQPQDFVSALIEPAKQVEQHLKVPYEVVIAQAALETGWGKKIIQTQQGQSSNNLFNIKADSRWQGDKTSKETLEFEQGNMVKKKEPFRVYESLNESINDYIQFLSNGERYQSALKQAGNVEQFLQGLQSAGYATDPNYATKIMGTLKKVTQLINQ